MLQKEKKEKKTIHSLNITKDQQREASAAYWRESWWRASQTFMPRYLNKKGEQQQQKIAPKTSGSINQNENR